MKKFAFFLPQYHEIEENNLWWGKGFTEWTNVTNAKPLYKNHMQPKIPLDNNYYNLLDKNVVKWQTELLKKYCVDGFIYYHYYFCGKKLLEKPAENLLKWKDIKQPFFFCWANHTWYRSWQGTKEILIEQKYGNEDDWNKHFEYLLPFFQDERYEKIDNKPLFMIYDSNFKEREKMLDFFNNKCKENGFAGMFIINTVSVLSYIHNDIFVNDKRADSLFLREPAVSYYLFNSKKVNLPFRIVSKVKRELALLGFKGTVVKYDGNKLFDIMIQNKKEMSNNRIISGLFFEWDNTPRHKERGYVITPPTKDKFLEYMSLCKNDEYIFINAWNEWAEGMMLEPTVEDGYKYLEWIKEVSNKGY